LHVDETAVDYGTPLPSSHKFRSYGYHVFVVSGGVYQGLDPPAALVATPGGGGPFGAEKPEYEGGSFAALFVTGAFGAGFGFYWDHASATKPVKREEDTYMERRIGTI
jgi:hypothetical protein